jgi:hypothetical protein
MSTGEKSTKTIEFWRRRHRAATSGTIRRTMFQMTVDEAGAFPEARPLQEAGAQDDEASHLELDFPEFADTRPEIGRLED